MHRSLGILVAVLALSWSLAAPARAADVNDVDFRKLVFFTVLEGLYELDLPDDVVDHILQVDPRSGHPYSFIQGCPVCTPVRDAFELYRRRPALGGAAARGFGQAAPDQLAALRSEDPMERTHAVGRLVQQVMARQLASGRWSAEERTALMQRFRQAAQQGDEQLRQLQAKGVTIYQAMWSCTICDGARNACKR